MRREWIKSSQELIPKQVIEELVENQFSWNGTARESSGEWL
jgi:hypothetical protein